MSDDTRCMECGGDWDDPTSKSTYCVKCGLTYDQASEIDRLRTALITANEKVGKKEKECLQTVGRMQEHLAKSKTTAIELANENATLRAHVQTLAGALKKIESVPSCQEEECCTGGKVWAIAHDALSAVPADLLKQSQARETVVEEMRITLSSIRTKAWDVHDVLINIDRLPKGNMECEYVEEIATMADDALAKLEVLDG